MHNLLLLAAVLLFTVQTICFKKFNLDYMKNLASYFAFNFSSCLLIALIFVSINGGIKVLSTPTVILGAAYGALYVITVFAYVKALETGPMAYSALFFSSSLLIPVIVGSLFWNEKVSLLQLVGLGLLLITFYLINFSGGTKASGINLKWLLFSLLAFAGNGSLGAIVKEHQRALPGKEINEFLIASFGVAALMSLVFYLFYNRAAHQKTGHLKNRGYLLVVLGAGSATAFGSQAMLYLSSRVPSIVLFPVVNGGVVFLAIIASLFVFNEKLSGRGRLGLCLGILSICFLSF